MENINILLDIVIALLSLWVLFKLIGYGGTIGNSLSKVGYGIVIIGLAQATETIGFNFISIDYLTMEVIYRLILRIGFFFIAWGFRNLMTKKY